MKSPFAKFRNSDKALESTLRGAPPRTEFPVALHDSIMRAVHAAHREERAQVSAFATFQRFVQMRGVPVTGFASVVVLGALLMLHNHPESPNLNPETLPEISAAFSASQEMVDAIPSVTVGPLSDELDKVNQDLDRTAKFLLATMP
jgi:hypothetical protein